MKTLYFYFKIIYLYLTRRFVPHSVIRDDYDDISKSYDECFAQYTAPLLKDLTKKLGINSQSHALDLGCGTGAILDELSQHIGEQGRIVGVDASKGMLDKARARLKNRKNIEFIQGDISEVLKATEPGSFDFVTCGWVLSYSNPPKLLRLASKVLKKKGKIGIIEGKRNTLLPLRNSAIKVMKRYPQHARYLVDASFRLPKGKDHLTKLFRKAGLKPLELWEGQMVFHFKNAKEAFDWADYTGPSAGFRKAMKPSKKEECDRAFIKILDEDYKTDNGIYITLAYVCGIAEKI